MLILIIESSGKQGCLILAQDAEILASLLLEGGPQLSKTIAQEVKNLLSNQVPDLVAVGIGPGSYTGIRVGVALGRALAFGWEVPCLGFQSPDTIDLPELAKRVFEQFSNEGAPPFSLDYSLKKTSFFSKMDSFNNSLTQTR